MTIANDIVIIHTKVYSNNVIFCVVGWSIYKLKGVSYGFYSFCWNNNNCTNCLYNIHQNLDLGNSLLIYGTKYEGINRIDTKYKMFLLSLEKYQFSVVSF